MAKCPRLIAVALLATCGAVHAYDPTFDFSTLSNPNGVWQYGYSIGNGAYNFIPFNTPFSEDGGVGWRSSTYMSLGAPAIWANLSGTTLYGVDSGQISLHPGFDLFSPAILRFNVPATGGYSYWVQFFAGDYATTNGSIFVNGIADDRLPSFASTNGDPTAGGSIVLNAGDRLDVVVGNNGFGTYFGANTPIDFVITAEVPEPSLTAMLALGSWALMLMRQRRRDRLAGGAVLADWQEFSAPAHVPR